MMTGKILPIVSSFIGFCIFNLFFIHMGWEKPEQAPSMIVGWTLGDILWHFCGKRLYYKFRERRLK